MPETAQYVEITSAAELREMLGEPMPRTIKKERQRLHPYDRAWIAAAPFCVLATAGADGTCDARPRATRRFRARARRHDAGIPERPGNRRADGYLNVLANPHVGVLFVVPGRDETLRVNGRARLVRDAPFFDQMVVQRAPAGAGAAWWRSSRSSSTAPRRSSGPRLWQPETWADPALLPSMPCIVKDTIDTPESLAELERYYGPEYDKRLYTA